MDYHTMSMDSMESWTWIGLEQSGKWNWTENEDESSGSENRRGHWRVGRDKRKSFGCSCRSYHGLHVVTDSVLPVTP